MAKKETQKVVNLYHPEDDSLSYWKDRFMKEEIIGDRTKNIEAKIEKQLQRFTDFFRNRYGHERVTAVTQRDVRAWLNYLEKEEKGRGPGKGFSAATINNHKAHLSLFMGWLHKKSPHLLPEDPTKGRRLRDIQLPAPEVRAFTEAQLRSLINLLDRLERFYTMKGRAWANNPNPPLRKNARPKRNRAIVYLLLASGIRREMLVNLNLHQLEPNDPEALRAARRFKLNRIKGKGRSESRKIIVDKDAREALADYLEFERPLDAQPDSEALFLNGPTSKSGRGQRLSVGRINKILSFIGEIHDAEQQDQERKIQPLRTHDFRHTYAVYLAMRTGGNKVILQRELDHANDRYLATYTNFPDELVEDYQAD